MPKSSEKESLLMDSGKKDDLKEYKTNTEELFSDESDCSPHKKISRSLYALVLFASIGNFLNGYNASVISGALVFIKDEFNMNYEMQGAIASVTLFIAVPSSMLGGYTNDKFGRKPTLLAAGASYIFGALLTSLAESSGILFLGRTVLGIGKGFTFTTVGIYVAEASPIHVRGALVTVLSFTMAGGQMAAAVVAGLSSQDAQHGWRYMFGSPLLPSLVMFIGCLFMPESPRWLVSKEKYDEARLVLRKFRGTESIEEELKTMTLCQGGGVQRKQSINEVLLEILRTRHVLKALVVGCCLQLFYAFAGITVFLRYSATIIEMSGYRNKSLAVWLTTLPMAIHLLLTLAGAFFIERIGRKPLLISSLLGTFLSLSVLAIGFQLITFTSPAIQQRSRQQLENSTCSLYLSCAGCTQDEFCGFCYNESSVWTAGGLCLPASVNQTSTMQPCRPENLASDWIWSYDYCPTHFAIIVPVGLVLFSVFFSIGIFSLPLTINSEIYPLWASSTGNAISFALRCVTNMLVSFTFLPLTALLTTYGVFWLYASLTLIATVFTILYVPETKGKTIEEVEEMFKKPWC